jgi:hypothetical protein
MCVCVRASMKERKNPEKEKKTTQAKEKKT